MLAREVSRLRASIRDLKAHSDAGDTLQEEVADREEEIRELIERKLRLRSDRYRSELPGSFLLVDETERPFTPGNDWLDTLWQTGDSVGDTGSKQTLRTYAYALCDVLDYLEANDIDWRRTTDDHLIAYRLLKEADGLRPLTIQIRLKTVGRFFKFAAAAGFIPRNPITYKRVVSGRPANTTFTGLSKTRITEVPAAGYARPERRQRKLGPRWLPAETVMAFINSVSNPRDRLMMRVLYESGIRRSELTSMHLDRFPAKDNVEFRKTGRARFPVIQKGGTLGEATMSLSTFLDVWRWVDRDRARLLQKNQILSADDPSSIWVSKDGLPLTPTAVNHAFNRHSGKFGISVTPHTLRHSYAMVKYDHDVRAGVSDPMRTLQLGLRHKSPATTIEVYYHRGSEDLAREAEADQSRLDRIREACKDARTPREKH